MNRSKMYALVMGLSSSLYAMDHHRVSSLVIESENGDRAAIFVNNGKEKFTPETYNKYIEIDADILAVHKDRMVTIPNDCFKQLCVQAVRSIESKNIEDGTLNEYQLAFRQLIQKIRNGIINKDALSIQLPIEEVYDFLLSYIPSGHLYQKVNDKIVKILFKDNLVNLTLWIDYNFAKKDPAHHLAVVAKFDTLFSGMTQHRVTARIARLQNALTTRYVKDSCGLSVCQLSQQVLLQKSKYVPVPVQKSKPMPWLPHSSSTLICYLAALPSDIQNYIGQLLEQDETDQELIKRTQRVRRNEQLYVSTYPRLYGTWYTSHVATLNDFDKERIVKKYNPLLCTNLVSQNEILPNGKIFVNFSDYDQILNDSVKDISPVAVRGGMVIGLLDWSQKNDATDSGYHFHITSTVREYTDAWGEHIKKDDDHSSTNSFTKVNISNGLLLPYTAERIALSKGGSKVIIYGKNQRQENRHTIIYFTYSIKKTSSTEENILKELFKKYGICKNLDESLMKQE